MRCCADADSVAWTTGDVCYLAWSMRASVYAKGILRLGDCRCALCTFSTARHPSVFERYSEQRQCGTTSSEFAMPWFMRSCTR